MPKSDDGSSVANYRSTSLLSILSKLLEIPTHWVTVSHLEVYYKTWAMAVDKGKEVCAIFFDLKKAIKVSLINWFKSDWVCPKMDCVLSAWVTDHNTVLIAKTRWLYFGSPVFSQPMYKTNIWDRFISLCHDIRSETQIDAFGNVGNVSTELVVRRLVSVLKVSVVDKQCKQSLNAVCLCIK